MRDTMSSSSLSRRDPAATPRRNPLPALLLPLLAIGCSDDSHSATTTPTPPAPPLTAAQRRALISFDTEAVTPAVLAVGDLNGDGTADLAVGDPDAVGGRGRTRVFDGATGRQIHDWFADGLSGDLNFGTAMAAADVDGDGAAEVFVTAPNDAGEPGPGALYGFLGRTGARAFRIAGAPAPFQLGTDITTLGDVDGDGRAELAIAEPNPSPAGAQSGRVHVMNAAAQVLYSIAVVPQGAAFAGPTALAGGHDVNGDSAPDLLVAADGPASAVYSGADGDQLFAHDGGAGSAAFAGDLDDDGVVDYAFGYPDAGNGRVDVFSGATGDRIRQLGGTASGDGFGDSLAPLGDHDGDGVDDLAIGSRGGYSVVVSGATGDPILEHRAGGAGMVHRVRSAGDLDGDGTEDVAIAANRRVLVLAARDRSLAADVHRIPTSGGTQGFALVAGTAHAERGYVLLGSASGTAPGITAGGVTLPLNFDSYTDFTLSNPNTAVHLNTAGVLDTHGRAAAALVLPEIPAALNGLSLHHAYVVLTPRQLHFASNAVPLLLTAP